MHRSSCENTTELAVHSGPSGAALIEALAGKTGTALRFGVVLNTLKLKHLLKYEAVPVFIPVFPMQAVNTELLRREREERKKREEMKRKESGGCEE